MNRSLCLALLLSITLMWGCPSDTGSSAPASDAGVAADASIDDDAEANARTDAGSGSDAATPPREPERLAPKVGGGTSQSPNYRLDLRIGGPRGTSENSSNRLQLENNP